MDEPTRPAAAEIEPGMVVEATEGDLGRDDMRPPTVAAVVPDDEGGIAAVVVKKGLVFQKEVTIPVERIAAVRPAAADDPAPGSVRISTTAAEVDALAPTGAETLPATAAAAAAPADSLVEQVEQAMPTDQGLRDLEERPSGSQPAAPPGRFGFLRILGPGFLGGMAGNDASAVTSYALDGAAVGYGHLWLILLATPLLQAVLYACGKIGRITQRGLAEILRAHYGRRVAGPAALLLVLANVALIAADLVAVGSGLELLTGLAWAWFVAPVAAVLWYITVYQSFDAIKRVFLVMSLVFVGYLITGVLAQPDWGQVLTHSVIPQIDLGFAGISAAVALLGATISPYSIFWQVQGEKEEQRAGPLREKVRSAAWDIGAGVVSGNAVAYFIMVSTAATLFTRHQPITNALDAARALEPLVGPYAKYLFAVGLIGAGLIAIPVLLASASYAVAGTIGWPHSLAKKPWQNEGFYLILTVALGASLGIAVLGFDPVQLQFWANVLQGVLAPALVVLVLVVGNNRAIMKGTRLGGPTNLALGATALLMIAAAGLLVYGLLTGQGG